MKNMEREQLLLTNKRTIQNRISVSITCNRYLPNISKIITKNWNILQISLTLQKVLDRKPMITYKKKQESWRAYRRSHSTRQKCLQDSPSSN